MPHAVLFASEVLTQLNPARLLKAIAFAADKHRHQRRKDAEASPYINHPIAVATVLAVEGDVPDEATLLAAALHDTVEDTQTTFEELEEQFGPEVTGLVRELTDDKSLPKAERKRLQIEHAPHSSVRAKQLKIADKICNVRDITATPPADWSVQRRRDYLTWSEQLVAGCRGVNTKRMRHSTERLYEREAFWVVEATRVGLPYAVSRGSVAGDFRVGKTKPGGCQPSGSQFHFLHPKFWTHFEVCNREVNCSSSRRTASYIAGVGVASSPSTSVAKPLNVPFSSANWSAASPPCCFAAW